MEKIEKTGAAMTPEQKRLLVGELLRRKAGRHKTAPTSFEQGRLWFLNQLTPGSGLYNVPFAQRLTGTLDEGALERSFREIVARHESLRTAFATVEGEPVQVIAPDVPFSMCVVDLRRLDARANSAEAERLAVEVLTLPFDLKRAPLFRVALVRLAEQESLLLLTMHHIVSDGWSLGLLLRELSSLYSSFAAGRPPSLPPLPIQYADYAAWQRRALSGPALEAELAFWRSQLDSLPAALALPSDRPRPPAASHRGSQLRFSLDPALTLALRALCRAHSATPFMALLASFAALLSRLSGRRDFCVGTPVANRALPESEPLIGLFINTLALRLRPEARAPFAALLGQVRRTSLDAFAHQGLPFAQVVEAVRPGRSLSHSPLFQVMFMLQNLPGGGPDPFAGLRMEPYEVGTGLAKFDLTLALSEAGGGLEGALEYALDLFEEATAARLLARWLVLLRAAVADPAVAVGRLPLLADSERREIEAANATGRQLAAGPTLLRRVARQAGLRPEAVAVECGARRLTYAELWRRSNALARRLRRRGVGAESLVGVLVGRSAELVVALLGVMKAGGAYVPLDGAHPAARLRLTCEDAGLRLVVGDGDWPEGLEVAAEVVGVGEGCGCASPCGCEAEADWAEAEAEQLAYVIYTSGSTGTPKGVAVTRRSLDNFLRSMEERPGLRREDVVLAVTTVSFDIAALELWLPLAVGGRVVLARREEAGDGERLLGLVEGGGCTVVQATPATWRLLLAAGWGAAGRGGAGVRALCGGEALGVGLAG
jgi:non-ribosomal peptide synthetase component F